MLLRVCRGFKIILLNMFEFEQEIQSSSTLFLGPSMVPCIHIFGMGCIRHISMFGQFLPPLDEFSLRPRLNAPCYEVNRPSADLLHALGLFFFLQFGLGQWARQFSHSLSDRMGDIGDTGIPQVVANLKTSDFPH